MKEEEKYAEGAGELYDIFERPQIVFLLHEFEFEAAR